MRYYNIQIISATDGSNIATFSTMANQQTNGAALKVNVEIFQSFAATPVQNSYVRIYGVDYSLLHQAQNLNDQIVIISVGMAPGLPLANLQPAPATIAIGTIFQAFSNWQGNLVTLDLVILPYITDITKELNLSGVWPKGNTLESCVRSVLGTSFPNSPISGGFSSDLVFTEDQPYTYTTFNQFASFVSSISKSIITAPDYLGANIVQNSNGFMLTDGTAATGQENSYNNPLVINVYDVIGNLTWIDTSTVQAKVVMRGDLFVGQYITFPKGFPIATNSNTYVQLRDNMSFQGVFLVQLIHHSGDSRQPDANSWVTIINATIAPAP